jgi:hypothetical protein
MKAERNSRIVPTVSLLIAVCLVRAPARADYGGGSGTAEDPYLIYTAQHVYDIGTTPEHLDKHFKLMADIDMGTWAPKNFCTIGINRDRAFTGTFEGNGHTISHLTYILSGATEDNVGLFGYVGGPSGHATIKNLGLIDPNIDASTHGTSTNVGALVGCLFSGTIVNCYVEGGRVLGHRAVGGLVGGFVMTEMMIVHVIEDCHTRTPVSGISDVGGLVGASEFARVSRCYATGNVSGYEDVGGLVGSNFGWLSGCYSTGRVLGVNCAGGLVGLNDFAGEIVNCYSTGRVLGDSCIGGLAGANRGGIELCYSRGSVEGMTQVGGLVGSLRLPLSHLDGTVTHSFWDVQTSGQGASAGGIGKTRAEMQTAGTFLAAGWDFVGEATNGTEDIWWIDEGKDYPRLRWETPTDPSLLP